MAFGAVDPQYAVFRLAFVGLAIAALLVWATFVIAWLRRRVPSEAQGWRGVAYAALIPVSVCAFIVMLALEAGATDALTQRPAGWGSWLLSFPLLLALSFVPFVLAIRRARWPQAYVALAAGPGLGALLVMGKTAFPRYPNQIIPFFDGAMGFPDHVPALTISIVAMWCMAAGHERKIWLGFAAGGLAAGIGFATQTFPRATLAGLALGTVWVAVCLLVSWLIEYGLAAPNTIGRCLGVADSLMQRAIQSPYKWLGGLIAFGIALRILSYWWTPLAVDAFSYAAMAQAFLNHGTFTMPWGDVDTYFTNAVPSHHYPPLFPAYLAVFFAVLGTSQATLHVASIVSSLAALLAVYLCTRDLYGNAKACLATAMAAISPLLVQNTGQGYSENLVLLLFVTTLWAILKSLERGWFIALAGVLAGLGYLTKSSMGYFFVVAGLGGLGWRLYWKGWKVLRDPPYLIGIAAFGLFVLAWGARNYRLFGSWETSQHLSYAFHYALFHPLEWVFYALVTFVFFATAAYMLYLAMLPWLPALAKIPRLDSEHDSGLWLALGLPLLLTAAIDAALWLIEKEFFLNNVRYVSFVAIPLIWLLMRHVRLDTRSNRLAVLATVLLLLSGTLFFAKPSTSYNQTIANAWVPMMEPGDSVTFVDGNNHFAYRYFFHLTRNGELDRKVSIACYKAPLCPQNALRVANLNSTWVLSPWYASAALPPSYVRVQDSPARGDAGHPDQQTLWRRTN